MHCSAQAREVLVGPLATDFAAGARNRQRAQVAIDHDGVVSDIDVHVLDIVTDATNAALARLLPQVSSRAAPLTSARTEAVIANPSTRVIVASIGGDVVGMALLLICTTLTGQFGLVEEVAVDEEVRGRHVGVRLMVGLLSVAHDLGLDFVELTSRPSREAANGLYRSLGFRHRETNVYRHDLRELPEVR